MFPPASRLVENDGDVGTPIPDPGADVDEDLPLAERSVLALWRKCPHLGCQVPQLCDLSFWFECLCHGSKYTILGEKRDGPAPRGMDHFPVTVTDGAYIINTGEVVSGPPPGTVTFDDRTGDPDAALRGLGDAPEVDRASSSPRCSRPCTMLYWFTDGARREAIAADHAEELSAYGEVIFSDDDTEPAACRLCAVPWRRRHGWRDPERSGWPPSAIAPHGQPGSEAEGQPRLRSTRRQLWRRRRLRQRQLADARLELGGRRTAERAADRSGGAARHGLGRSRPARTPRRRSPDTVEAGEEVFNSAGCVGCHGPDLLGSTSGPNISTIGSDVITDFGGDFTTPVGHDQMIADYAEDPRMFLENWIRDSSTNYNGGEATGMPPHDENALNGQPAASPDHLPAVAHRRMRRERR
jgi:hypothetical protein